MSPNLKKIFNMEGGFSYLKKAFQIKNSEDQFISLNSSNKS